MSRRRRRIAIGTAILAVLIAISIPVLFRAPPPSGGGVTPPADGGGNGGQSDRQAPETTLTLSGPMRFMRESIEYFYPSFKANLHATDNTSLSTIILSDTGATTVYNVNGLSAAISLTVNTEGLHQLQYYSVDVKGNKETAHEKEAGISKPELSDLENLVNNSNIDNPGIKNALIAKIHAAQHQLETGHELNSLDALLNQLYALEGKHGLDSATVQAFRDMISLLLS